MVSTRRFRKASIAIFALLALTGCANPSTPAGYVGYVTQGAWFGHESFYGVQQGPTSTGAGWLLKVTNVSVTPYTYSEPFEKDQSVLSKDNLKLEFRVHIVFKINPDKVKEFIEKYSTLGNGEGDPNKIVSDAYENFLKEPLRTYARDEVQKHNGLELKDNITVVGDKVLKKVQKLTAHTPFEVSSIVVGNIQYPEEVANAVAEKMAITQVLEKKRTEIAIEQQEAKKRFIQAQGIAKSMDVINGKLTARYLQHEAIEAQKAMVGSPNHTTIYIPVGPNGVPLVGTLDTPQNKETKE